MTLSNLLECWLYKKCKPCSALDFKGVGNKITMDDGIF